MKTEYKNILWRKSNITPHLTGSRKIILFIPAIILLAFCIIFPVHHASATQSFSSTSPVSFTINPTISISVSDLRIGSLAPGDYKDSNIITVTAESNAIAGYRLSGTVGSSSNSSTELRKDGTDTTNIFTSISTNKASLSDFDENSNTWGYSYSTDSGTTWISGDITGTTLLGYNGLPLYTTDSPITLINSPDASTNSIQFKIGARSTNTQVAGVYTNVINFIGIANPNPGVVYMQEATLADCGQPMIDKRDNNIYTTTLVGDTCWMTKNLDLPGGTRLSSEDTDFDSNYTLPTTDGWTTIGDKLVVPASSTTGFDTDNYAYVYNSGKTGTDCSSPGCYSYYSWDTATVGSGRSIADYNTDAPYSICPKGWHLPNTKIGADGTSDFHALMIALGGSANITIYNADTTPTGATIFNSLSSSPLNFLRAGNYLNGSLNYVGYGSYWSSTSRSNTHSHSLTFSPTYVYVDFSNFYRRHGLSIRCVMKNS